MKENVKQILYSKHILADEFIRKIDAEDKKELFDLLKKRKPNETATSFIVDALARISPAELVPELTKMLKKPEVEKDLVTAITYIGRIGTSNEEKYLLKILKNKVTPVIAAKTALSLARIGTQASIKPLLLLAENAEIEKAPVRLGVFLLSSRLESKWQEIKKVDFSGTPDFVLPDVTKRVKIELKRTTLENIKAAYGKLINSSGIQLSDKEAFGYLCGRDEYMLTYNLKQPLLQSGKLPESINCPVTVLLKSPVDESWSIRYFAFLTPDRRIYVLRTDGYRLLQGTLKTNRFTLQSVTDKPVAAMEVNGKLADSGLVFEQLNVLSELIVRNKMIPSIMKF